MQETKSFRASFSQASTFVFLGKLVRYSLQYFTQVFLINILLPDDFGLMRYVTLLVGMCSLINEMGLTTAIVQKQDIESEEIFGSFIMSIIWGGLLYIAIFFSAPLAASFFDNVKLISLIRVGSILIPLSSVCSVPRALLQRQLRFGTLSVIEGSGSVISSMLMIFLAMRGFGTWSLIAGSLLMEALSLTIFIFVVKFQVTGIKNLFNAKKIIQVGAGIVFLRILDYLRFSVPFFVIGKLFDEKLLGIFSVSYDISLLPYVMINAVMGNVAVSTFSRLQNDKARTESGFAHLTFVISLLIVPMTFSMVFLSEEIIHTVCFLKKNDSWLGASTLIRWLGLVGLFNAVSFVPGTIWLANRKIKSAILWSVTMLLSTVIALVFSVNIGIETVAIALLVRAVSVFPLFLYVNKKITGIRISEYLKAMYPAFICSITMLVAVVVIQKLSAGLIENKHLIVLFTSFVAGGSVYLMSVYGFLRSSLNPFPGLFKK